ncbi:MAG: 50S ribosomal protein L15 [Patescibacteria group bacterium]
MRLHTLTALKSKNKGRQRVGRGLGSGRGTTSGRGTKGQKARTGGSIPAYFEGGQKPLVQIIPKKKGFRRPNRPRVLIINIRDLSKFASDQTINLEMLRSGGYLDGFDWVKILGEGDVAAVWTIEVNDVSASARQKIEKAGGKITLIK